MTVGALLRRCRRTWAEVSARQPGEERPLRGYTVLAGGYSVTAAAVLAASARTGTAGQPVTAGDLALISVATHRLSRILTKETVTAPLRAPFTRYVGPGMASEVEEKVVHDPVHHPLSHAVGELLTCPFCMAQWTATALMGAHLVLPRQTRIVTSVLTAVTAADGLHFLYGALERLEEPGRDGTPQET